MWGLLKIIFGKWLLLSFISLMIINSSLAVAHTTNTVTIHFDLPKNIPAYQQQAALSAQEGRVLDLSEFSMKTHAKIVATARKYHEIIEQTASALTPHPGAGKVIAFSKKGAHAYLVLAMDEDGWAGVSAAMAAVRPMVEHNLIRYSDIEQVSFGYQTPSAP